METGKPNSSMSSKEKRLEIHILNTMKEMIYLDTDRLLYTFLEFATVNKEAGLWSGNQPSATFVEGFVQKMNVKLNALDMEIKKSICQITGKKYYVLFFAPEKPNFTIPAFSTESERQTFMMIMELILRKSHNFSISVKDCLRVIDDNPAWGGTPGNGEYLLYRLTSLNYLTKTEARGGGREFTLGPRTLLEFDLILRNQYSDCFGECCRCKLPLLNGLQCVSCSAVIHPRCHDEHRRTSSVCISCNVCWKNKGAALTGRSRSNSATKEEGGTSHDGETSSPEKKPGADDNQTGKRDLGNNAGYNGKLQKHVLKAVKDAGCLEANALDEIILKILRDDGEVEPPPVSLDNLIPKINRELEPFDMTIRRTTCDMSGKKYYVFLFSIEKPLLTMSAFYTEVERDLFLAIGDNILRLQKNFALSWHTFLRHREHSSPSITWSTVPPVEFVKRLTLLKYFHVVEHLPDETSPGQNNFKFTLSFRTLLEFECSFMGEYSDVFVQCCCCQLPMLGGYTCQSGFIHKQCLDKHLADERLLCETCHTRWSDLDQIFYTVRNKSHPKGKKRSSLDCENQGEKNSPPRKK